MSRKLKFGFRLCVRVGRVLGFDCLNLRVCEGRLGSVPLHQEEQGKVVWYVLYEDGWENWTVRLFEKMGENIYRGCNRIPRLCQNLKGTVATVAKTSGTHLSQGMDRKLAKPLYPIMRTGSSFEAQKAEFVKDVKCAPHIRDPLSCSLKIRRSKSASSRGMVAIKPIETDRERTSGCTRKNERCCCWI